MNNLHISLTEFRNESRVLKQTNSLIASGLFSQIFIVAIWADGLLKKQNYSDRVICNRLPLKSRKLHKNFLTHILKYLEFCWKIYRLFKGKNVKVVNIHSLDMLPLGLFLKWSYKAKLIYDTHELETETNGLTGIRKKLYKIIEKYGIRKVDLTLVVSENIADWYSKEYHMERPPVVKNAPRAHIPEKTDVFREKFNIRNDQTIFLYQGSLMPGRGIPFILETFKHRSDDKAVIIFMGYGELENYVKRSADVLHNVYFMPAVSPSDVLEYTVAADVGLSLIENTCLSYYYCMPNKLFEYSMAGLVTIVSNMKEMAEFVLQNTSGFVLEEATKDVLNKLIDKVLQEDLQQIKHNAQMAALNNSWEVQEQIMLDAYSELLKK